MGDDSSSCAESSSFSSEANTRSASIETSSESDAPVRILRHSKRHVHSETITVPSKRTRTIETVIISTLKQASAVSVNKRKSVKRFERRKL